MTNIPKKVGKEKIVFQGNIVEIVQQEVKIGTETKTFEIARRSPGTRLIILNDKKQILLTKERRLEINSFDYRLPGGKVFNSLSEYKIHIEQNQDILTAAQKGAILEAKEECGIKVNKLELLHVSKCGATIQRDLYYFVVTEFEMLSSQELESGENISLSRVSIDMAREICLSNSFSEERSAIAMLKFINSLK